MILNLSKIKTEALLLFCKDLINSYINEKNNDFNIEDETFKYINNISNEMLRELRNTTYPNEYYLKNAKNYRIKAILDSYNIINKEISKNLEKSKNFNPSMLFFSLLALWFKELNKESRSKEYIYFIIYPYTSVYDKLLVNIKNDEFKKMNVEMIELADKVIIKLENHSFKR